VIGPVIEEVMTMRPFFCAFIAAVSTVFGNLAIAYGTEIGVSESITLWLVVVANVFALFTQPLFGMLADRIGRKPVFVTGVLGVGVMVFVFFSAIGSGNAALICASAVVLIGVCYAAPNGVYVSWFPEQFPARVRYSGMAIGLMVGLLAAGFTPALAQVLSAGQSANWTPVAWMCAGFVGVAAVAALTGPETYRTPTSELGRP